MKPMIASVVALLLLCISSEGIAQQIKYFRKITFDGRHRYQFSYELPENDAAMRDCFRVSYDARNRPIRWQYLSAGRPAADLTFGLGGVEISYEGDFEKHTYYNKWNRPVKGHGGEWSEKFKYEPGAKSMICFQYDRVGRLIDEDEEGCSRYLWMLDSAGRMIKEYCLNSYGNKISNNSGVFEVRFAYDHLGYYSEVSYFNEAGKPMAGKARKNHLRDSNGNTLVERLYDGSGQLLKNTAATTKSIYDKLGYLVSRVLLNSDDLLISRHEYVYDARGNEIESRDYSADGELESTMAVSLMKYDDLNQIVEQKIYNRSNTLLALVKFSYNEDGQQTEIRFYDEDENPIRNNFGYSRLANEYDGHGNLIKEAFFDVNGNLVNSRFGYAYKRSAYLETGEVKAVGYFDASGKLVRPSDEQSAAIEFEYDDGGKLINTKYYDARSEELGPNESTTITPPPALTR